MGGYGLFPQNNPAPVPPDQKKVEQDLRMLEKVSIDSYHAGVFDMSSSSDRSKYCDLMLDLSRKVQSNSAVIWRKDTQVLHKADGSQSWMTYIEWSDFSVVKK